MHVDALTCAPSLASTSRDNRSGLYLHKGPCVYSEQVNKYSVQIIMKHLRFISVGFFGEANSVID